MGAKKPKDDAFRPLRRLQRRIVKKTGKVLIRSLWGFFGRQSLVGDTPIFEKAMIPGVQELEANWPAIRRELDVLLKDRHLLPPFQSISSDQKRIAVEDRWKTYILVGFGHWSAKSGKHCPVTKQVLGQIPDLQTAMFSILAPGYHIPPHQGITRGLTRIHLALKVPADRQRCRIRIAGTDHFWQEGECLVFDDTFEHEVWNDTSEERVVLLLDVKRPMRWPGRAVNAAFIWAVQRTAYFQRAKRKQAAWEDEFEAAVNRAEGFHLEA